MLPEAHLHTPLLPLLAVFQLMFNATQNTTNDHAARLWTITQGHRPMDNYTRPASYVLIAVGPRLNTAVETTASGWVYLHEIILIAPCWASVNHLIVF